MLRGHAGQLYVHDPLLRRGVAVTDMQVGAFHTDGFQEVLLLPKPPAVRG